MSSRVQTVSELTNIYFYINCTVMSWVGTLLWTPYFKSGTDNVKAIVDANANSAMPKVNIDTYLIIIANFAHTSESLVSNVRVRKPLGRVHIYTMGKFACIWIIIRIRQLKQINMYVSRNLYRPIFYPICTDFPL